MTDSSTMAILWICLRLLGLMSLNRETFGV
jgi:hypothetical protein